MPAHFHFNRLAWAIAGALALHGQLAAADEPVANEALPTVTVTAQKREE